MIMTNIQIVRITMIWFDLGIQSSHRFVIHLIMLFYDSNTISLCACFCRVSRLPPALPRRNKTRIFCKFHANFSANMTEQNEGVSFRDTVRCHMICTRPHSLFSFTDLWEWYREWWQAFRGSLWAARTSRNSNLREKGYESNRLRKQSDIIVSPGSTVLLVL